MAQKSWKELPIMFGEEHPEYNRRCAHYAHIGCPGWYYEDTCPHPTECALRGRCKVRWERTQKEAV